MWEITCVSCELSCKQGNMISLQESSLVDALHACAASNLIGRQNRWIMLQYKVQKNAPVKML